MSHAKRTASTESAVKTSPSVNTALAYFTGLLHILNEHDSRDDQESDDFVPVSFMAACGEVLPLRTFA